MLLSFLACFFIFYEVSTAFSPSFGRYDLVANNTNDEITRFFIVGDWGGSDKSPYTTPSEVAVADAMGKLGQTLGTTFQLALGDNFYTNGVKSTSDPRFQTTFEDVFVATSLRTPWYLLAGNHDHKGNVQAQIEYGKISKRWVFPDYFYTFSIWSSDKQTKLIDFVMLDTILLCGGKDLSDWDDDPIEGPEDKKLAEDYWQWIEEVLRASTAPYLIVSGHFPVYSIASHGPTKCLVDRLRPLLHKYHATAYMCGHDHNLQHLATDVDGEHMNYFVVGAGGKIKASRKHEGDVPAGSLKFYWADSPTYGGFALVEFDDTKLTFSFIDYSAQTIYQTTMLPRS